MATQQTGGIIAQESIQNSPKEQILVSNNSMQQLAYKPPQVIEDYQRKYVAGDTPVYRPTRTVVVKQSPAAGQVVPPGTVVLVTLVAKDTLPVKNFQTGTLIANKYGSGNISTILSDLDTKGQTVTPILGAEKSYEALSASEKNAVVQYAQSVGLSTANDADTKSAYEDLMFFNNL